MIYKIQSMVMIQGIKTIHEYEQKYDENENVFGRLCIYHEHMSSLFPNCQYKMIKAVKVR